MFETIAGIVVVGGVLLAFMAYQRSQVAPREVNPIAADDSDMAKARSTAQETLGEFRGLFVTYPQTSLVKLPVTSSSGTLEWMVGDVVELTDTYVKVQFRGRPVTHRGAFQSLQTYPLREIADWQVTTSNGRYRGGYTQRVTFARMRADGTLVGSAADEASRYD